MHCFRSASEEVMCIHVDILLISLLLTFIGFALASYEPGSSGCKAFQHFKTWSYLPCEPKVFNADPIARVFEGQLYVYTSWDDPSACGSSWEGKKEGYQQFWYACTAPYLYLTHTVNSHMY